MACIDKGNVWAITFGFTGDALTVGAIVEGATRDTSEAIEAYISDRVPASE